MLRLKKAFDCVDHPILLTKLYKYGIREMAFNLFEDYLKNRYQYTSINTTISNVEKVKTGVRTCAGIDFRPVIISFMY